VNEEVIMESRKVACMLAAGLLGASITVAATASDAKPNDIVVEGKKFDPETQRRVSYADLNLASSFDQRTLKGRISRTARVLCVDLGYSYHVENTRCRGDAIHSTDDQVVAAIQRAQDKMAGRLVGPAIAISMVVGAR
jgi:UrcA family protein